MTKSAIHIILLCLFACVTMKVNAQDSLQVNAQDSLLVQRQMAIIDSLGLTPSEPADTVDMAQLDSAFVQQLRIRKAVEDLKDAYSYLALKEEKRMVPDGAIDMLRGSILMFSERNFIRHPGTYSAYSSRTNMYDYIPAFTPLAATWIMKASGVQSRSKIQRMLVANAMAFTMTVGLTEGLKYASSEVRPNGGTHTFPSGHAAMAFASATILDREYGHISPWISVGGYVCATGTQMLRIKHNAHWLSDLAVGAGIGTFCTNLAYFITDRIFGDKGVNRPEMRRRDLLNIIRFMQRPSGFHFLTGTEMGDRTIHFSSEGYDIRLNSSYCAGFAYNHYFDESWALDANLRAGISYAKYYPTDADPTLQKFQEGGQMDIYHADLGGRYSTCVLSSLRLGAHAFAGVRYTSSCLDIKSTVGPELGIGINGDMLTNKKYIFGFKFDYTHTFASILRNRYFVGTSMKIIM